MYYLCGNCYTASPQPHRYTFNTWSMKLISFIPMRKCTLIFSIAWWKAASIVYLSRGTWQSSVRWQSHSVTCTPLLYDLPSSPMLRGVHSLAQAGHPLISAYLGGQMKARPQGENMLLTHTAISSITKMHPSRESCNMEPSHFAVKMLVHNEISLAI